jgi:16S rRNA (cytosine967-C5)-methyltransferase
MPGWLLARWEAAYGAQTARRIAEGSLAEPALDLTVRGDATGWAQRLGGVVLPTGSVRLAARGRIEELAGFAQGAWWVQDAAAAIPARMLGEVAGRRVADLCAAPGGKTAQLASAGARVTAVDLSPARLARLRENLARVQLAAATVEADIETWRPAEPFDAVLLDAPCSATGTIRRHPDLPHVKSEADVAAQAAQQAKLLDAAAAFVAPGGRLVYCTCSLEPEEGPAQAEAFLARHPDFLRLPVDWTALGVGPEMVDAEGALRTLPFHGVVQEGTTGGMDGFYAVLLGR